MNGGAAGRGGAAAGRASARVRCETGNPRRGAARTPVLAPHPPPPPPPPLEIIFTVLLLFPLLSCNIFFSFKSENEV